MLEKGLSIVLVLFIIPELLGLFLLRFLKKENTNLFLAFIIGYVLEFAICQIVAVPYIYMEKTFTELMNILTIINLIVCGISAILNLTKIKEILKTILNYIKETPKILAILTIVLIGIQVYSYVGYMHIDDDDSFYVGTATVSVQTDSLFKYSAATGEMDVENQLSRYRLGPFPIYLAVISKAIDTHPAIVAHTILPIIFVPLVYMIYGLIGNELFKNDKKQVYYFLMIMSIINIWGNYSVRTAFSFFLIRIWQGKALLASMILPLIILLFIKAEENNYKFNYCLLLFIAILAGNLTTTMGIALPPMELMLLAIVYEISKLNFKKSKEEKIGFGKAIINLTKCLICCIPSIIYGIAYLII